MSVRSPRAPSESFPLSFLPSPNRTPPHGDVSSQFLNKAPRTFSVLSPDDAFAMDGYIVITCICERVWSEGPLCRPKLLRISSSFRKWCSISVESIHPFLLPLSTSGLLTSPNNIPILWEWFLYYYIRNRGKETIRPHSTQIISYFWTIVWI